MAKLSERNSFFRNNGCFEPCFRLGNVKFYVIQRKRLGSGRKVLRCIT
jgi:hypothetical protein